MYGMSQGAGNPSYSVQYSTPATGATVTGDGSRIIIINPAGTIATLTVVLPASPTEGQECILASSQIVTALTITGTITGTLTTLAAGGFARFVYSATAAKWFRAG